MVKIRIIPILLLRKNSVVKTVGFNNSRIVGDAITCVKVFSSRMADEMIILDIDATESGVINSSLIRRLSKNCMMPLTVGGGVRDISDADSLFRSGADKISVNSAFYDNKNLISEISGKYGRQAIVFSLDTYFDGKQYFASSHSAGFKYNILALDAVKMAVEYGAGEILLNSVERDGAMNGYDLELIANISDAVDVPVIAAGGCGDMHDCVSAIQSGASAVAAGSIFHWIGESIISIKKHMNDQGIDVRLL